jgi:predicted acyltransferase
MAATSISSPSVEQTLRVSQLQAVGQRYVALDALRGFVMLVLVSGGFGLSALLGNAKYHALASQFEHLPWNGFVLWELIMPSFMFMVGRLCRLRWRAAARRALRSNRTLNTLRSARSGS